MSEEGQQRYSVFLTSEAIIPDDFGDLDMNTQDTTWPSEPVETSNPSAPFAEPVSDSGMPDTSYVTAEWTGSFELHDGILFPTL